MTSDSGEDVTYPRFVLPGERVACLIKDEADTADSGPIVVKLGPGLVQEKGWVVTTKAGMLDHDPETNAWIVESDQKRYVPVVGENVVGVITHKLGEAFRVDIGTAHPAVLSYMAFEGASKRNRPNLDVGDLVYARVAVASKDMDPELECTNPRTHKADGFGHLAAGFLAKVPLAFARRLFEDPNCAPLKALAKHFTFDMAIGLNGRVWVNAGGSNPATTVHIAHAIQVAPTLADKAFEVHVKEAALAVKRGRTDQS
ncbi:exosome non-catalytic core subunit rrp40 [Blastocladiella emersonii ATCC 22665]|nr:exosome non-catalytic core subunit rrp40 [Blastocladiella emersonii ATCC 22665]